ncbi:hypothetical protein SAMN06273572_10754 [Monaibacterium marinum]|uniref:Acetoacetate decarboxylase (ADC) n=1 Tax=Pontivivens marinum TaxID=1690039 RepID=A0A2C9CUZ9_9RHOB|nr:hypothetical protein [Monaibacterium marinum]SOH95033.1 hypothetical protein SAMN06273572_10754 [Monaibacterium marinum]
MTDTSHLPNYIDRLGHGEICFPQPLRLQGTTSYAFALEAKQANVQAFVDSQLNAACAPELRYETVGDTVLLTFLEVESATSLSQSIGVQGDREAMFWVPLWEYRKGHIFPRLTFWVPYLLINVDTGLVVGREIWGYRKTIGDIQLMTDPGNKFVARTTIFPTLSDTTRAVENAELITVTGTEVDGVLKDDFHDIAGMMSAICGQMRTPNGMIETVVEGAAFAWDLGKLALDFVIPVVNLKQFRASEDWTKACYQSITESPAHLDKVHGGGLLPGEWSCTIRDCESHQIANDLGLTGTKDGDLLTADVRFAFWVNFDFTTRNGKTLWQAMS